MNFLLAGVPCSANVSPASPLVGGAAVGPSSVAVVRLLSGANGRSGREPPSILPLGVSRRASASATFRSWCGSGCTRKAGRELNLMRTKTIEQSIADTEEPDHQLRKELGAVQLTVFGVGVVIGTGIFVLTGEAAGEKAGPAVALSFVFAGLACALAALCYAEFASTVPVAGSAYTFSYASLGRARRLDHRLGPDPGAGAGCQHGGRGLVDVLRGRHGPGGDHDPGLRLRRGSQPGRCRDRADPHRGHLHRDQDLLAGQLRLRRHQAGHRAAGDRGRAVLHQVRQLLARSSHPPAPWATRRRSAHPLPAAGPRLRTRRLRHQRDLHRCGAGLLRLHRLRHRRHGGGGDQEPAARHAHRHPGVARRSARCSTSRSPWW